MRKPVTVIIEGSLEKTFLQVEEDPLVPSKDEGNILVNRFDGPYVPDMVTPHIEDEDPHTQYVTKEGDELRNIIATFSPSEEEKNRLEQKEDGLYVSDDLESDPLAYYILSKS